MAKTILIPPQLQRDKIREFVARHHPEWLSEYDTKFPKQEKEA